MTMKTLARVLVVAGALSLAAAAAFARSTELHEPGRTDVVAADPTRPLTSTLMRRAIIVGGAHHDWKAIADNPGVLTLTAATGTHVVVVDVAYDAVGFQVKFKSSQNLNQERDGDKVTVHPRVNKWLADLNEDIRGAAIAGAALAP